MTIAENIVLICEIYLLTGLIVSVVFLVLGIEATQEGARGSFAFRPLLLPGLCLLWPLVIWRWRSVVSQGGENE